MPRTRVPRSSKKGCGPSVQNSPSNQSRGTAHGWRSSYPMTQRVSQRDTIRILIADDHPVFRFGLRTLIESEPDMQVVGEASDGVKVVSLVRKLRPDILLLDLAMPERPGLEVLRQLANASCPVRTIILSVAVEKGQIIEAIELGACGIVLKDAATQLVTKSIRTVMAGQFWVGHESVTDLLQYVRNLAFAGKEQRKDFGLTPREREVLSAVVEGSTNRDIAQKLTLSEDTVKHHLSNIFDKTGVST